MFNNESDFEDALTELLKRYGWEADVLMYPSEADLIDNWARILFNNNREIDRLNDYPLTDSEMQQIIEQIVSFRTPLRLNGFINGGSVTITRDNPDDTAHLGKEVSLKIYDRREIAGGKSRYQIVRQPKFPTKSKILNDRRGDLMLLINGMPVIHIELKKSGISVSQAYNQIEKYAGEGIFSGLFSLVQIFVAMTPEETVYFANPGPEGVFNPNFYFHWADFNNEPVNDWKVIGSTLLSIPMAHQMIGFYTVADDADGVLKVMRSYQYYAASAISDRVSKTKWGENNQLGGFVWHTTGSGKTMTSFKSAQLIATSKDADKVVFLVDRIELGTQSLKAYRNFAGAGLTEQQKSNTVQETEDTHVLISKLKSADPADTLIVTSIQKMSNISDEHDDDTGQSGKPTGFRAKSADIEAINSKRIVFIVDEAHRSTFGDMLHIIKGTFPHAIFFGFTGTPIQDENQKKDSTTSDVFGNELHRYSIADGIRDKNVLGFDPYKVLTFKDKDVRTAVALEKVKAKTEAEALADPVKKSKFMEYITKVPMAGYDRDNGTHVSGIEDYLSDSQYRTGEHQKAVVNDIIDNWLVLSQAGKFHAIFATSSIPEAIEYYDRFRTSAPNLKVTALFDPTIDNNGGVKFKEDGLVRIIEDYNARYDKNYSIPKYQDMKKDISFRLAHKSPYERIDREPEKEIDLLIVVDQMLTGFDSKWINTLYMDKVLAYEHLIQAFSRTNRLFGPDKPFGTIKYYRRPHTMEKNIEAAVKLYSGDKPLALFVSRLRENIENMNRIYGQICSLFKQTGVLGFTKLPNEIPDRKQFAKLFKQFNECLEAAKVQGFSWKKSVYEFYSEDAEPSDSGSNDEKIVASTPGSNENNKCLVRVEPDETTYLTLVKRYKELFSKTPGSGGDDIPYELDGYITTIDTDRIDSDYMNSKFDKYLKKLHDDSTDREELRLAEEELHKSFATLSQEEQKNAELLIHDIQRGDIVIEEGRTFREYVIDYVTKAKDDQIHRLAAYALGVDEMMLRSIMSQHVTEININEFGRFDSLKETMDRAKAKSYFEAISGEKLPTPKVNMRADALLRDFILMGGFDIEMPEKAG